MKINKILVFRLSSIGDIVLTSALVRTLRKKYPQAQIDFVIKKQFASLIQHNPHINTVYSIDKEEGFSGLKSLTQKIRSEKYDVFLDIHKNFRSLYVRSRSGAKYKFKYKKHVFKRSMLIQFGMDLYNPPRPVYKRFIDTAAALGVEDDGLGTEFYLPDAKRKSIEQLLEQNGATNKRLIVVCPGASFTNKQWLPEGFSEVANRLSDDVNNAVVVVGGMAEYEIGEHIRAQSGWRVLSFCGKLDLLESAALLEKASVVCANDTGMLHIAEALNVPVVGIYGPTVQQFGFFPILPQSKVVEVKNLKCRPCTKMGKNNCPKKHFNCMKQISADRVYETIKEVLQ